MAFNYAHPQCYVEVYPFEGGAYYIQGGQILSCTTTKNINNSEGTFEILLAPGGPYGPNSAPTWTDVITPMSFTMIGMVRDKYSEIVMLGVVTRVSEVQQWKNTSVRRLVLIVGQDFSYFFNTFNWVVLSFLGSATNAVGQALGANTNFGLPAILGGNYLNGPPDQVGKNWYQTVMDGQAGVLSKTTINYRNNRLSFSDAMGVLFEQFSNFSIPLGISFLPAEGTFLEKFKSIFEWPWYEFFITTAPTGFYPDPNTGSWTTVAAGTAFSMQALGQGVRATPYAIARVNPLPHIQVTAAADSSLQLGGIITDDWNGLNNGTIFYPDPYPNGPAGFLDSDVHFDEKEVRNFYMINPTWNLSMLGVSNASIQPAVFIFQAADDPASLHRYGYRPEIKETNWFNDVPPGPTAQKNSNNTQPPQETFGDLLSRLFSYYEPTSLMMRASLKLPLRPDLLIGCRFQYNPFKGEGPWLLYIDQVSHHFEFGGPSTTEIRLSRGLPLSVYSDTSQSGVLTNLHIGNAMRMNGNYQVGLPPEPGGQAAQGLKTINLATSGAQQVLSDIAQVWQSSQKK